MTLKLCSAVAAFVVMCSLIDWKSVREVAPSIVYVVVSQRRHEVHERLSENY